MVSSARRTITCILLSLCTAICVQTQTTTPKPANGSISGKVTIKGKPAVGITVVTIQPNDYNPQNTKRLRAKTDQSGSYRITNLPAGTYEVSAVAPALVPTNESNSIVISESEEVEDVNLSLTPGGVITGKVTDSENEPLVGATIKITPDYGKLPAGWSDRKLMMRLMAGFTTDDRGIYRAFGLPPGKYKVSAGEDGTGRKGSREYYKETFHPSVTDAAKATSIEVTEGSEAINIDIVMGRPVGTFRVAGRVIDGETGKPVPNLKYGVGQRTVHDDFSSSSSSSIGGEVTNANGEFRLENVAPGSYTIFTVSPEGSALPPSLVSFDVVDRDLTDLVITIGKRSTLSGVVTLDGNQRAPVSSLRICAALQTRESSFINAPGSAVAQDGTFRIEGVRSGPVALWLCSESQNREQFEIVSVERNGVLQPENINVKQSEHVAGIRVLVKHIKLTGTLRGQVKIENAALPPVSQLSLSLWPLDENLQPLRTSSIGTPELDARGRFFAEGLPAGNYRLSVSFNSPGVRTSDTRIEYKTLATTTEQVVINDDAVTEVTLILKPQSNPR